MVCEMVGYWEKKRMIMSLNDTDKYQVKIKQYCRSNLGECFDRYIKLCEKYKRLREANIEHNIYHVFNFLHLHEFIVHKDIEKLLRKTLEPKG